jgi:hypothetical protein
MEVGLSSLFCAGRVYEENIGDYFPVHDEILANEIVDPLPKTAVAARAAATHYYDSIWCDRAYTEADASIVFN